MAMVPYMAAGYAVDRLMGGSGMTGLALGAGVGGFGTGAFGEMFGSALAPELTASELATGMSGAYPAVESASILSPSITGADMMTSTSLGALSPEASMMLNPSLLADATAYAGPSLFEQGKRMLGEGLNATNDLLSPAFDTINEGWSGMDTGDQMTALSMGDSAVDRLTSDEPQIMAPPPKLAEGKEPTIASPVAINVQAPGVNYKTRGQLENMLYPEQRRQLGLLA